MRRLLGLALLAAVGCGATPSPAGPAPLTAAEWAALPADRKYAVETLERLRETDPKFAAPGAWEEFLKTTVLPARKKDVPKK